MLSCCHILHDLQQHLPLAVCAAECEAAEEQSDDEVRISQVPEQSEGKTKMMKQQYLPFTVLKHVRRFELLNSSEIVATVLTVHGMRRRVRDSRGAKRR